MKSLVILHPGQRAGDPVCGSDPGAWNRLPLCVERHECGKPRRIERGFSLECRQRCGNEAA